MFRHYHFSREKRVCYTLDHANPFSCTYITLIQLYFAYFRVLLNTSFIHMLFRVSVGGWDNGVGG